MNELKTLFDECEKNNWIPQHDCKKNLKIISQTHSLNSSHNIVIEQITQCKICGKQFKESDSYGIK